MSQAKDKLILDVLRKKSSGTVAIFDRGDHYKCYGDDALLVANRIILSEVGLRRILMGTNCVEMVYLNLNDAQFNKVVKELLLLLRYRVEVYAEIDGKLAIRSKGVLGNMVDFEEIVSSCVELTELSTVMCAHLIGNDYNKENHVIFCFCNSEDMTIAVSEVNDSARFSLVEQSIVSLNPRECVLFKEDLQSMPNRFKQFEKTIERCNVQKYIQMNESLTVEKCRDDVRKLLKSKHKDSQFGDKVWETIHFLLSHMQILGDSRYDDLFTLNSYGSAGYMYISNAAVQALEIFSPSGDAQIFSSSGSGGGVATTLYDLLNRCRSQGGKKLLKEWMRRPLFDLRRILERHDVVEALCTSHEARFALHDDLLRRIPDIGLLSRKLAQKKASLQDCYRLYQLVRVMRRLETLLCEMVQSVEERLHASIRELLIEPIQHNCAEFERFSALIESTLDLKHCERTGQYRIRPDIDENLSELNKTLRKMDNEAEKIFNDMSSKIETEALKMESNSDHGYYFRVTLKSEKFVRSIPDKYGVKVIEATKGGGLKFFDHRLIKLNEKFCAVQSAYNEGQAELTKAVITTCAGYIPALQLLSENLSVLDVLTSFAIVAASSSSGFVRPEFLEAGTGVFELIECRHPVVEQLPGIQFIPNDTRLGTKTESETGGKFIVLTGANMGGKSTYLRANALAVFMAQLGSFVACSSARFSLIDGIYTRVGAGDYQSKGVSTFMAEMMDCGTILDTATKNSFILVDELGRGTSTYDGFGLAWAIAEEIINRLQCFCLFATHFHELAHLKEVYPKVVQNFKVETIIDDNGKLTILYQVVPGVTSRSFGLNVAKLVGFSDEIINDASKVLKMLEHVADDVKS